MSSKGTIFMTNNNEHVYNETNDWSVVFEINKDSIDRVEMNVFNTATKKFNVEIMKKDDFEYLVVQTKPHYSFLDSFKTELRSFNNIMQWFDNNLGCLNFEKWEISTFEDEIKDLSIPFELRIFLNKESEWYYRYVDVLKQYITGAEKQLAMKKKICMTIETKGISA